MGKNPIVKEFVRKFDEIQYDMDAHHWLLAVVIFFLVYQFAVAWSLVDMRDGLLAANAGQQKIYKDIHLLQEQITSLRAELTSAQQRGGPRQNVQPEEPKENAGDNVAAPAPVSPSTIGGPEAGHPKAKRSR